MIPELLAESRSGAQALKEVSMDYCDCPELISVRGHGVWGLLHGECLPPLSFPTNDPGRDRLERVVEHMKDSRVEYC